MNTMENVIEEALGILRRKAIDGYEVYVDQSSYFDVESKDGKVETLQASHSLGMAFRILNRQQMGFSYTTFPNPSPSIQKEKNLLGGIERIIEDAISSATVISSDPCLEFAPVLKHPPISPAIFDETLEKTSWQTKIEKAKCIEEAARSVDPLRIKKVRKAAYREVFSQKMLVNSNGLHFSYVSTLTSISVTAVAEESGKSEMGWDFDFSHFLNDLDVPKAGQAAGKKALEKLGGKRISSGAYPVLIRNSVASEFLSLLAHSFLAEQVQKGKSFLKGKKGERVFSPFISILDDGLHPKGISTFPVDGEGTPSQRTSVVTGGEICGYLYDLYWANRENTSFSGSQVRSTGNSRRSSIKLPPAMGISNFFIESGKLSFVNLLKDLNKGLVVEEVMGLHTVNPITGDFSRGCSGDWIESGEKAYPVKSIAIAGNLFQLFEKVAGVGDDFRFFGGVGSPSLLVENLEISGN